MKKIILWSCLGLIVFVVILLSLAPARTIYPWFTDSIPELHLDNVQGTIWSTKVDTIRFRNINVDNILLTTNPLGFLVGGLHSTLGVNDKNIKLDSEVALSNNDYQIDNANFEINTTYIAAVMRLPIDGLEGIVSGTVETLHMTNQSFVAVDGSGQWENAVIVYPNNNLELGDVNFELSKSDADDKTIRLSIVENNGVLDLKGFIDISLDKRVSMNLHTTSDLPQNLKSWVSRWGRTDGNRIYLQWQGQLP